MKYLFFILTVFLVSCAPTVNPTQLSLKSPCLGSTLYSKINRNASGLRFLSIEERPGGEYTPYIRLNDLRPMFSTKSVTCVTGELGKINKNLGERCLPNPLIYREKTVNGGDFVLTGVGNVLTLGGLAGPKGKPLGVGRYSYTSFFDYENYQKDIMALDQVADSCQLISLYDEKKKSFQSQISHYKSDKDSISIKLVVDDRSGFYSGSGEEFLPKINITTNDINNFSALNISDSTENNYLNRLEIAIEDFLDTEKRKFYYNVKCQNGMLNGFNYQFDCKDRIDAGMFTDSYLAKVKIYSKKFTKCIPDYYFSDKNISGNINRHQFNIENNTEFFVTVESLSIYYRDTIFTSKDVFLELPPNSQKNNLYLSFFEELLNFAQFSNLIKDDAENTFVNFGVAIKYKIINENIEKTLFQNKKFRLIDLLQ